MRYKKLILSALLFTVFLPLSQAQLKLTQDTLATPIFGFNFGTIIASDNLSTDNGMHDLYVSPYLNYGLEAGYKFKSNWIATVEGNLIFGNKLRHYAQRSPAAFSYDTVPFVIGTNGSDANVSCYNRMLSLRIGGGKIITLGEKNPNSGLLLRLYGGIMQQKTIFKMNDVNAPQLQGDYARLYDHKRRGVTLTESVGYWFMSNHSNFFNFYISFDVTQCWNHSVRAYVIDEVMDLHGPDNTKYFDLFYTIKISWMFPLKGKTAYDYYFF
ncbi:MAG: hypothetical protein J6T88_03770 [Bacteroidales bacterium]|nr:hypothetical protein [Bacteroidales bacterium]